MDRSNAEFDPIPTAALDRDTEWPVRHQSGGHPRAPDGKHVLISTTTSLKTTELSAGTRSGNRSRRLPELAEAAHHQQGPENIIGRWVNTPLDLERRDLAWKQGNSNHIGSQLVQQYGNRPFAEVSDYRLPVEKLYLTGPSSHPGASIMGGGRATAYVVMEDLGIDFDDVVG